MNTYQHRLKLLYLVPCLLLFLTGCDNSKKTETPSTTQQTEPPAKAVALKRAPRTVKAFQEAVAAKTVGVIRGNVRFNGTPPPPEEMPVTFSKRVCGREPKKSESLLVAENRGIQNVVVSLLKIPKGLPTPTSEKPLQLDQQKCVFIPHVLIVPVDTEFDVLNNDETGHNFHAIGDKNPEVNKNQSRNKRDPMPVKFAFPEVVRVVCDVHSWMSAWIIVAEHPYYALTDSDGQFRLENVPEGNYQLRAWHETLGEQTGEVTVETAQEATVDFEFSQP
jgi:plastocyanin